MILLPPYPLLRTNGTRIISALNFVETEYFLLLKNVSEIVLRLPPVDDYRHWDGGVWRLPWSGGRPNLASCSEGAQQGIWRE